MDVGKKRPIKEERETILLTTDADGVWEIYTFNTRLKNRLRNYAEDHPDLCKLICEDIDRGCVTYTVKKPLLSIHLRTPYSEDKREAASEYAKNNGFVRLYNDVKEVEKRAKA